MYMSKIRSNDQQRVTSQNMVFIVMEILRMRVRDGSFEYAPHRTPLEAC